jgi:hypothetical protein
VFADFVLPLLIDCNGNGISDALDIANGTSYDTNGNGTPDECEPCGTVIAYCVPSTSSNGCNATMSASGTPSVAAGSGFDLIATNVEGQKSGLVFYGVSGPKSSIWAPGSTSYLCVKSPTQRSPSSNSNGTANACDGSLSLDFLAYLATHPGAQGQPFSAGDMLWCQAWFRDPPAPDTTNLSDALQISLCP